MYTHIHLYTLLYGWYPSQGWGRSGGGITANTEWKLEYGHVSFCTEATLFDISELQHPALHILTDTYYKLHHYPPNRPPSKNN
jgi:hypothetical protein